MLIFRFYAVGVTHIESEKGGVSDNEIKKKGANQWFNKIASVMLSSINR